MRFTVLLLVIQGLAAQGPPRTQCKPGDGILLQVQNEPTLTDTFTVTPSLQVSLPNIGDVSVAGVPRDQLTDHFSRVLSRYLRNPAVHAQVMVRIGVVGEVARPGFYLVPVDAVFADAMMQAGGPTKDAKVSDVHVVRAKKTVLTADATRAAIAGNATVDQVALESGDLITVPRANARDAETWVRIVTMLVTIPVAVFTISHMR